MLKTYKGSCSICTKTRNWSAMVKPDAFRLLSGKEALSDHRFGSGQGAHLFPEIGGAYVSVKVACLDDVDPAEIVAAPVQYANGRDNKWWEPPAETRHL